MSTIRTIHPRKLQHKINEGSRLHIIDVRTRVEYESEHIPNAELKPLDALDAEAVAAGRNGEPLYVVCQSGSRGEMACRKLLASGVHNVVNVDGGMNAWNEAHLPVITSRKKGISLERQVHIAAGLLVLLGIALAWLVNPYFVLLSALIGAGLTFAGITNTCGMGLLLARMPWNK